MKNYTVYMTFIAVLNVVLILAGCGKSVQEQRAGALSPAVNEEMQEETAEEDVSDQTETTDREASAFLLQIDTFYSVFSGGNIDDGEDMVGGHLQSGKIKTGDKAVLVKSDGTSYETTVEKISRYREEDISVEEAVGDSLVLIWLEGIEQDQMEYGDLLLGTTEWERGVPIDFPFEESEGYSLTLALQENGNNQGELRLYDKTGEVLQRISYGAFSEQVYYVIYKDDRRNLAFFSDEKSNAGRFLEWKDGRFSEQETDIKRGLLLYGDLLITQESESELIMEIYRRHPNDRSAEEIRRYTLQKNTGKLEIWDCLDQKNVFQETVSLKEDKTPVNEKYYQIIFTEGLYAWAQEGEDSDSSIPVDLCGLSTADEICTEYDSREAFLADYGFSDSDPIYKFYDRMDNLRLELYGNESDDLFCGILYKYLYNNDRLKIMEMSGFAVDDITEEEWVDDTCSVMSLLDSCGYEESIEYTSDGKPAYYLAEGIDEITSDDGTVVTMMEVEYIYRDDGTLYERHYRHNPYQFSSSRCSESSLYDERERLVYENAYITHGTLEDYYIYPDDGEKPAYCLEFDYAGGDAPCTSMVRYH